MCRSGEFGEWKVSKSEHGKCTQAVHPCLVSASDFVPVGAMLWRHLSELAELSACLLGPSWLLTGDAARSHHSYSQARAGANPRPYEYWLHVRWVILLSFSSLASLVALDLSMLFSGGATHAGRLPFLLLLIHMIDLGEACLASFHQSRHTRENHPCIRQST